MGGSVLKLCPAIASPLPKRLKASPLRSAQTPLAAVLNRSPHPRSQRKSVRKLAPQHAHGINQLPNARFLPPNSKSIALHEFALAPLAGNDLILDNGGDSALSYFEGKWG